MTNANLEKLSWVLIYAGLLTASLGVFVHEHSPAGGWVMVVAGGIAAAAGAAMILVRSRRPD